MIQRDLWQEETLQKLIALLEARESVQALLLKGSYANPHIQPDPWSDLDVIIVVAEGMLDSFFPTLIWLEPLGKLYTFDQSSTQLIKTTRACFTDFRRIDYTIIQESNFPMLAINSEAVQTLFSRSPLVDEVLATTILTVPQVSLIPTEQFEQMVNAFWFKGMLATSKVMRNDLLIATHLLLEMIQDICVVEMMLRDRKLGTSHHREGGEENTFVMQLAVTQYPYTAPGILQAVKQCSILFDSVAARWSKDYEERRHPLLAWIDYAAIT